MDWRIKVKPVTTTRIISTAQSDAISQALDVIRAGGLIAFPTDTVYGLAADFRNPDAIDRIYAAKDRDTSKPVALLIGEPDQLNLIMDRLTPGAAHLARQFWPGALTLIVPRKSDLPPNLSNLMTIGVRMPAHPWTLELLRQSGPLATTSANLSGKPDSKTAEQVLEYLEGRLDLLLDGGVCPGGIPSTVVDCTGSEALILREGAITSEAILEAWKRN